MPGLTVAGQNALRPEAELGTPKYFLDPVNIDVARRCSQCGRCGAACLARIAIPSPPRLLRLLQLGLEDEAIRTPLLWGCISCRQCTMCCPQGLDVATLVVRLRRLAARDPRARFPEYLVRWFWSEQTSSKIS